LTEGFDKQSFIRRYPELALDPNPYAHPNKYVRGAYWKRLEIALDLAPPTAKRILDFGTGPGVFLVLASKRFSEVVGLDGKLSVISKKIVLNEKLSNVTLVQADGTHTGFKGGSFDVVFALDVLEHFHEPEEGLAEIKRLLKPGGTLVISAPTENWLYETYRVVFGRQKPADHYHDSNRVLSAASSFFEQGSERGVPFDLPAPLSFFRVKAFKKPG